MSDYIDIIPIYKSDYIEKIISDDFSLESDMVFQPTVKNIRELRIALLKSRNPVVLICAKYENIKEVEEVAEFLDKKGTPFIALCDNSTLNYELMRSGVFAVIDYEKSNNVREQKMLLRQIKSKILDACNIKTVIMNRKEFEISKRNYSINSYFNMKEEKDNNENHIKLSDTIIDKLIVVGASTGGTEALIQVLKKMPQEMPPMLIVQHMPPVFTKMYAQRCDYFCKMKVQEAQDGDRVLNGNAYIAPGDYHMRLVKRAGHYYLSCMKGEKVKGVCPSVDVLFNSVADIMPKKTIGVILTGMGSDGAEGLLRLRKKGAFTIGQDEKSSVVYGMPKEAYDMGAVAVQADIEDIAKIILDNI